MEWVFSEEKGGLSSSGKGLDLSFFFLLFFSFLICVYIFFHRKKNIYIHKEKGTSGVQVLGKFFEQRRREEKKKDIEKKKVC